VSAHDIAAELRRRKPGIGNYSLHKLLYFAQGYHLAWTGRPLFREHIEAWRDGPVVAQLWYDERHHQPVRGPGALQEGDLRVIDYVLSRHGMLSAAELIELTHAEGSPWDQVRDRDSPGQNEEITTDSMAEWFQKDAELGALRAEVDRVGQRGFDLAAGESLPGLASALERVLNGERVNDPAPN